jgi:outer membrane protein OmpA-like peptidoglycan-associated protein
VCATLGALALLASGCAANGLGGYDGPVVAAPDSCIDRTASIYFNRDSATLTTDARQVLRMVAAQAESCQFTEVDVYGLSDPVGAPAANRALSDRRAQAVTSELARLGFDEVTFKLVAAGEEGAMTETGEVRPLRRRVDIIFSR